MGKKYKSGRITAIAFATSYFTIQFQGTFIDIKIGDNIDQAVDNIGKCGYTFTAEEFKYLEEKVTEYLKHRY